MPNASVSAAGRSHARANSYDHCSSFSRPSDNPQGHLTQRRSSEDASSKSQRCLASSALEFRPRCTPDSYLQFAPPPPTSSRGRPAMQRTRPVPTSPLKRPFNPRRASSCVPSWTSRRSSLDVTATFRGQNYRPARETADGKICLHTHHHHYWIMSDPARMQQSTPQLRSAKKRVKLQQTDENSRADGTLSSWPSEGGVEGLAEAGRPASRNTNQRYLVEG